MMNPYSTLLSFLPEELRGRVMLPKYIPITTLQALGATGTADLSTPLNNVAAFLLTGIVGRVYTTAAPETSIADPGLTIDVRFSSGDDMTDNPVPFSAVVQSAGSPNGSPYGLVAPRLVPGGSTIGVTLTNYSGVANLNVRLGLVGIEIFSERR